PPNRLKSHKPFWSDESLNQPFSAANHWKSAWAKAAAFNRNLVENPNIEVPGLNLPRAIWCKLNRQRTGHGKCNDMLYRCNAINNPSCECGEIRQTIKHIVEECPQITFLQGFDEIHQIFPAWLLGYKA
ncbi:hypothetical protein BDFB_009445, partial [Asbolus verrucosus]